VQFILHRWITHGNHLYNSHCTLLFGDLNPQLAIIIIILCIIDSGNVNAQSTSLSESRHRSLWSLQITIILTEGASLIFLQFGVEKIASMGCALDHCSVRSLWPLGPLVHWYVSSLWPNITQAPFMSSS